MAEIRVKFAVAALERARAAAQAVKEAIQAALERVRDPGLRRGARALGDEDGSPSSLNTGFRALRRARFVENQLEAVLSGREDVTSALLRLGHFLPGPLGRAFDLTEMVKQAVDKKVEEEVKKKLDAIRLEILTTIERERFERDLERRLKEDPDFEADQSRQAFRRLLEEEAAGKHWIRGGDDVPGL